MLYRNGSGRKAALRPFEEPAPTVMFGQRSNKVDWVPEDGDEMTWGLRDRPAPTVTGGGGKASGIEIFDQQSRYKMLRQIEEGTMEGNDRVINPNTPLDAIRVTVEEASILQSFPPMRPAMTIVGTRRSEGGIMVGRQLGDDSRRDVGGKQTAVGLEPGRPPGHRVSGDGAGVLQSFPESFIWDAQYEHVNEKTGKRTMKPVANTKKYLIIGNAEPPLLAQRVLEALWSTDGPRVTTAADQYRLAA